MAFPRECSLPASPSPIGALRREGVQETSILLRVRARSGVTPAFTRRLRDMVAAADPGLKLHDVRTDAES